MPKETISKEWTAEERLKVIFWISSRLRKDTQECLRPSRPEVFKASERIVFLSSMPAYFLETNRAQILEGLE